MNPPSIDDEKQGTGLTARAALYYNPIPLDGEGGISLSVDISTGLTLSQSIFSCFQGNAAYATIRGGVEEDGLGEGEGELGTPNPQRERKRER